MHTSNRAFFLAGAEGVWDRSALLGYAYAGQPPWNLVHRAQVQTNRDYRFNHAPDILPDVLKGGVTNIEFWNIGPMSWDAALTLYQIIMHYAESGEEINFVGAPASTNELVNKIIEQTHILPELAWTFYTNLDRIAREAGLSVWVRPSLKGIEKDLPSFTADLSTILKWAVAGFGMYLLWEAKQHD